MNNRVVLGVPVLCGVGANAILTANVTLPSTGGPYRLQASYSLFIESGGSDSVMQVYVQDGSGNKFAAAQFDYPSRKALGGNAADVSPVTYAAGSTVTLTLIAYDDAGGSTVQDSLFGALPTVLQVNILPNIVD